MSKQIRVELSEEEYKELKKFKDKKYLTWKGVLVHGTPRDIETNLEGLSEGE